MLQHSGHGHWSPAFNRSYLPTTPDLLGWLVDPCPKSSVKLSQVCYELDSSHFVCIPPPTSPPPPATPQCRNIHHLRLPKRHRLTVIIARGNRGKLNFYLLVWARHPFNCMGYENWVGKNLLISVYFHFDI